jgi:hypothetical protein
VAKGETRDTRTHAQIGLGLQPEINSGLTKVQIVQSIESSVAQDSPLVPSWCTEPASGDRNTEGTAEGPL